METIATLRDIFIALYLLAGTILALVMLVFVIRLYRMIKGLLGSATRAVSNLERISETAAEHIVSPLNEGLSVGSVAGNAFGFATGFLSGLRGKKLSKDTDDALNRHWKRWIPFL